MPKQYFFEAGAFPELSYTELICVLESFGYSKEDITKFSDKIFFLKNERITDILFGNICDRLGGCVRAGYVVDNMDSFFDEFQNRGKITFGISIIGNINKQDSAFLKKLGNQIKKGLKESKISSRFILPIHKGYSLNAAQIIKNEILTKGFELDILRNNSSELYARSVFIQDLEGFVSRDTQRPNSDLDMGILPPKLARMMVNLTALRDGILWDPFCGSGTVVMEAALLGFNVLASDINGVAVESTDENIRWLNRNGDIDNLLYETFQLDVNRAEKEMIKKLKNTNISAIVCEPFMGPPQRSDVSIQKAEELLREVKDLYKSLFYLIDEKLGLRGIKVVIIIPSYKTKSGWKTFGVRDLISNRWIVKNTYYSPSRDLKWSRKNSIITRNIFILERT